ncbi:dihydrodipicolinate synthase family protein [Nocardia sp. GCM10030253]|uniref:dihydrodipicolinate synthase family protein n=1 Tax=Nocardia sp. GCM10030253 TaxID=3273404 RepID=UPI00363CB82B
MDCAVQVEGSYASARSPIVAILTPFQTDGRIDFAALGDYLDLLAANGVRSILVNGTTAEFASLTGTERCSIVEYCRGRWPGELIAHIGSTAIGEAITLARHAHDHADRLAAISPYFFADAPEAGVEQYFTDLITTTALPVLLYNFPRHTQNPLSPDLVARLATRFPQLCGIKDSGKDLAITQAFKARCPDLQVFIGDDRIGAQVTEIGVDGVVTGAGGPVAELPVAIAAAARTGDQARADSLQRNFDLYSDTRKSIPVTDISFAKAALAQRLPGFPSHMRPPLSAATAEQYQQVRGFMRDIMIDILESI